MKALSLFLLLPVAQVILANDLATSGDGDRLTGITDFHLEKAYSSQTKSQQASSSSKLVSKVSHPTVSLLNPKPLKLKNPSLSEVITIPHTQVVTLPQPPTYISHLSGPEMHLLSSDHHLEVLQLSNGLQAVPLDDSQGHISDYLYLGSEIDLIPESNTFYLPATDVIDGHKTYVNLGTLSGHLSLSEVRIGDSVQQGFEGIDEIGPVFIPVMKKSKRLIVNPIVYRTNMLSFYKPSPKFSPSLPVTYSTYTSVEDPTISHVLF